MPSGRRSPADKYDERRRALAESALKTLGELGYARASLREIANNSDFSHGVVHYYFEDKHDLIVYCVREYNSVCVRRYDGVVAELDDGRRSCSPDSPTSSSLTLDQDAAMHRLWYDVRTQSLFDERTARRGGRDRRLAGGHDLADRVPLCRAGRQLSRRCRRR